MSVVFPAPVGPTMATFWPGSTLTENPWMTCLFPSYPKWTSLNSTRPFTFDTSTFSFSTGISS